MRGTEKIKCASKLIYFFDWENGNNISRRGSENFYICQMNVFPAVLVSRPLDREGGINHRSPLQLSLMDRIDVRWSGSWRKSQLSCNEFIIASLINVPQGIGKTFLDKSKFSSSRLRMRKKKNWTL